MNGRAALKMYCGGVPRPDCTCAARWSIGSSNSCASARAPGEAFLRWEVLTTFFALRGFQLAPAVVQLIRPPRARSRALLAANRRELSAELRAGALVLFFRA